MFKRIRESVIYFLYPNYTNPTHVLYLKKTNKPHLPIHNKLIGVGGGFEENEYCLLAAAKREIKEELGFLPNNMNLQYIGNIRDNKRDVDIHILKGNLENLLNIPKSNNEGIFKIKPIDYHIENPGEFLETDLEFLDKIYDPNYDDNLDIILN